ncbi:DUF6611 family protein [Agreia sp. Leaf335]|uniref:DUF6611 family protein n=1 Tax=Agreia sp. Leaf335 TaxID=1736340 RepID=UPI000AFDAED9
MADVRGVSWTPHKRRLDHKVRRLVIAKAYFRLTTARRALASLAEGPGVTLGREYRPDSRELRYTVIRRFGSRSKTWGILSITLVGLLNPVRASYVLVVLPPGTTSLEGAAVSRYLVWKSLGLTVWVPASTVLGFGLMAPTTSASPVLCLVGLLAASVSTGLAFAGILRGRALPLLRSSAVIPVDGKTRRDLKQESSKWLVTYLEDLSRDMHESKASNVNEELLWITLWTMAREGL